MKKIYLDYAATTPVDPEVFVAMKPYFSQNYGNPSEPHFFGQKARAAIDKARQKVANFLGAKLKEIIFTSCATESINLTHKGLVEALMRQTSRPHIITSSVEHKAVLEVCRHLENLDMADVTYLPVDKYGIVKVAEIEKAIRPETVLVSIMYINNEVGTIQPIQEIGETISQINKLRMENGELKIYFHIDATQAIQYFDCSVDKLGVDLLSFSGHKIYAPKGVGALYIRKGTPVVRQQDGGEQEYRLRAGTENVPYIVGLGKAIEEILNIKYQISKKTKNLRDRLIEGILKIPDVELVGHPTKIAPHIATFIVEGAEGEAMLLLLSDEGIAASSGSACTSGLLEPSHVLTAMGYQPEQAHGSLRFSLGKDTTQQEIDYVVQILPGVISRLRKMAPKIY